MFDDEILKGGSYAVDQVGRVERFGRAMQQLLPALSKMLAEITGKPEKYVMATVSKMAPLMAGKPGPAAFADIRGIGGFTPAVNKKVSQALCALLKENLQIPPDRVYMTFTDIPAANWGFNGGTFG